MMNDKLNDYINSHPKESLAFLTIVLFFIWQSVTLIIALTLYFLSSRFYKLQWWVLLIMGLVIAAFTIVFERYYLSISLVQYIKIGFKLNKIFWLEIFKGQILQAVLFIIKNGSNYLLGVPLLIVGLLNTIHLIPNNPHESKMKSLRKGKLDQASELTNKQMDTLLNAIDETKYDGTVLGISKLSKKCVVVPDHAINHVVFILGTTGGGKSITLQRFMQRAITQGYPLIIVDAKPDDKVIANLMKYAEQNKREFYGFNCGNFLNYNPLAKGGFTELKDKIICLKDEWSSDHYRSIAEDYLQTTFDVLLKSGASFDLNRVVDLLDYNELTTLVRKANDSRLEKRVSRLQHYERQDIIGLQAHLSILTNSELGSYFEINELSFNLIDVVDQNAVAYFALPALLFPNFSKVLGKLVITDLKTVFARNNARKKVFTLFDEFSVFAGDQVLNLVNMGRGKGMHAIFGTQGLADLDKVDDTFKRQVLNCANTLICHRLNDHEDAETIATWGGTQNSFTVTAQVNTNETDSTVGTVKRDREFIIHPDQIKQSLDIGEAFYITKIDGFRWEKVRVRM